MIDEKKMLDAIKQIKVPEPISADGWNWFHKGVRAVRELIDDQPKAGKWIPVEDRLPEKRGNYLCTMVMNGIPDTFIMIGHYNGEDHSKLMPQWTDDNKMHRTIAWMPLPEPWEGEK